ncbi:MAG TPA: carbohydrate porin [Terracidiphilus sp.]|nr:carbohydrate porin [Terracidiphilus sp.]
MRFRQSTVLVLCVLAVALRPSAAPAQTANQSESNQAGPATRGRIRPATQTPATDQSASAASNSEAANEDVETVFPHTLTGRYWVSGQANVILQGYPGFKASYSGPNSLTNWAQSATTHLLTLYSGYQLSQSTEVFADIEDTTGNGVGNESGLAGYVNLDVVRLLQGVPNANEPYLAQLMIREIIPLTVDREPADRDELDLATSIPTRRIEVRFGKMDLTDFFDLNTHGSDSNLQFLNWTVDDNGAWDVASNARGYTDAVIVEFDNHAHSARFAEALMPKTPFSQFLDADLARSHSENLELEARGKHVLHRDGVVRVLGYLNHAPMGSYRVANAEYLDGHTATPDIAATRRPGQHRYGFGVNVEQEIASNVGVFARLGWSDGHHEAYCYTEVDRTLEVGGLVRGKSWHRSEDRAGVAFVANGIIAEHQQYLALGGLGIMLGDGGLTYGREKIFETFYTAHLWRGFSVAYDFQHVTDPGYNQARGPVSVSAVRFHTDF